MYKIKQLPEDFIVDEISNVKLSDKGRYAYLILKKTDYTTLKAVEKLAKALIIPSKRIGYAGNKDRRAVTAQLISVPAEKAKKVLSLAFEHIELELKGYGNAPISLGDLEGNAFLITVRNIRKKHVQNIQKNTKIPNCFGEQRFGKNNANIGKAIIKKDFKKAVGLIAKTSGKKEDINEFLVKRKNDYIGALRLLDLKLLKLYIHSYQSLLFNRTLDECLKLRMKNEKLPIIGFGTEIHDKNVKTIIERIMKKEAISFRDFIIRELPELSSEGVLRDAFIEVKGLKALEPEKDELNKGMYKIKISFKLPKGCYATEVIKQLFKNS